MKILVTGGTGFLGSKIVSHLLERGHDVVSLARHASATLKDLGVDQRCGNLGNADDIMSAARGVDAVIHTAAKAGVWGDPKEFERVNVGGTRNVIDACVNEGIRYLVHTSSPSVVFHGYDQEGADESTPYPARFFASYPATKAQAERLVLSSNGPALKTLALRPHLIWGPGDPHFVPRILAMAAERRLRLVGSGEKLVDAVYVDNAAAAHIVALERLISSPDEVAGRPYFVTNAEPWPMKRLLGAIAAAGGFDGPIPTVPARVAYAAGWMAEVRHRIWRSKVEPRLTRFVAKQLATAHWYDTTAARTRLGYEPHISMAEGIRLLTVHLRDHGQT